mmetsp:Transcript_6009/g.15265  ORF Transcript_6009/g.15265 Transcript_6009/m.15265 type:complete len:282 (+) Transcript_6009:201-1046(+)
MKVQTFASSNKPGATSQVQAGHLHGRHAASSRHRPLCPLRSPAGERVDFGRRDAHAQQVDEHVHEHEPSARRDGRTLHRPHPRRHHPRLVAHRPQQWRRLLACGGEHVRRGDGEQRPRSTRAAGEERELRVDGRREGAAARTHAVDEAEGARHVASLTVRAQRQLIRLDRDRSGGRCDALLRPLRLARDLEVERLVLRASARLRLLTHHGEEARHRPPVSERRRSFHAAEQRATRRVAARLQPSEEREDVGVAFLRETDAHERRVRRRTHHRLTSFFREEE